jgi:hypothetical protein
VQIRRPTRTEQITPPGQFHRQRHRVGWLTTPIQLDYTIKNETMRWMTKRINTQHINNLLDSRLRQQQLTKQGLLSHDPTTHADTSSTACDRTKHGTRAGRPVTGFTHRTPGAAWQRGHRTDNAASWSISNSAQDGVIPRSSNPRHQPV